MDAKIFLKKKKLKEGDFVEAVFGEETVLGTIIPGNETGIVFLKLKSGYNIGLSPGKISSIKKISQGMKTAKPQTTEIKQNTSLPKISILHTGGTIASRVNYETGGVFASFSPEDLLSMFPELGKIANFESTLVSNIMSEDMRFSDYKTIAKAIEKEIKKGVKGIILGHGTDTLGYTSAALAFALENCPVPILLVGAQRSSDRGSSDAAMNLICAASFIAKTDFAGVAICMHHSNSDDACAILPACKTRKMHTSRRDAFKAINDSPIALVDYKTGEINFLKKDYPRKTAENFKARPDFEEKTGFLYSHPNMSVKEFSFFKENKSKGLVIAGTGLGHIPIATKEHAKNLEIIKSLVKSGCVVCMASQCLFGRVHPTIYANLRKVSGIGVIYCEDMLPETAFVKLAWLLGNYKDKEKIKELMQKNLCGEINERTPLDSKAPES
ncbi:MAG: Glu-tRNA(Gln) amidotransferase subunit GatD [Candidatus ainarchaeum sp.]|nr:Glu-tRNA(Gln) amidotransferase subunit GatD [Candidatus ainarchaeum sp.]